MLAHVVELVLAQLEGCYLLVSGPPQLRSATIESLAKDVQRRVGSELTVDIQAGPSAVAVEPVQRAIEEREEVATVGRMIEASPKVSAWGIRPTLDALYQRRVMTLAVDDVAAGATRSRRLRTWWRWPSSRLSSNEPRWSLCVVGWLGD